MPKLSRSIKRSVVSKRSGSKRSGSKRSGSKRSASKRSGSKRSVVSKRSASKRSVVKRSAKRSVVKRSASKRRSYRFDLSDRSKIIYFYETHSEKFVNSSYADAIEDEMTHGFLSNFYVATRDNIRQPRSSDEFHEIFKDDNKNRQIIKFMYDGEMFANSEQAFCWAKAKFFDPDMSDKTLFAAIKRINNPHVIKEISVTKGGIALNDDDTIKMEMKIVDGMPKSVPVKGDFKLTFARPARGGITKEEHGFGAYLGALFTEWTEVGLGTMIKILTAKFSNPFMKGLLMNTGHKLIVEAAPGDFLWGIGYSEQDVLDPEKPEAKPEYAADDIHEEHPIWYKIDDEGQKVKGQNKLGVALMAVRENFRR